MTTTVDTLAGLLGLDSAAAVRDAARAVAKNGKLVAARGVPAPLREAAAASLIETGCTLLNSPLAGVLGDAWTKARDLHAFTDASKYPPGQVHEYTLAKHDIDLKRNPAVELTLDGAPTGVKLEFELKLTLALSGAVLAIRDARIVGARVGDFNGAGKYSCAGVTLVERKTSPFRLPGDISFGQGLALV